MKIPVRMMRRLMKTDSGVTGIEYALLGAFIALGIVASLAVIGVNFDRQFQTIADAFPSVTPSGDDTVLVPPGGNPGGTPDTPTGPGAGPSAGPGPGPSTGPAPGTPTAPGPVAPTARDPGTPLPANPPVVAGNPPGPGANVPPGGANDDPFITSNHKPLTNPGDVWTGPAGTGDGSGSGTGRSGAIRTWSGNGSGSAASDIVAASTDASSHVSNAEPDTRVMAAEVAERKSRETPRPAQVAASKEPVSDTADVGPARGGNPLGAGNGLDARVGSNADTGIAAAASSRWGFTILVLLVLAAFFIIRSMLHRGAGTPGGVARSTAGSRARRAGLVIAPIRRTKTR